MIFALNNPNSKRKKLNELRGQKRNDNLKKKNKETIKLRTKGRHLFRGNSREDINLSFESKRELASPRSDDDSSMINRVDGIDMVMVIINIVHSIIMRRGTTINFEVSIVVVDLNRDLHVIFIRTSLQRLRIGHRHKIGGNPSTTNETLGAGAVPFDNAMQSETRNQKP